MSKIAIKGNESGTATFTIEAPATNTDRIFELPDEAGKILTDVGVPTSAMPAGSVIQVVSTTKNDTFSASVAAGVSVDVTGLSASITPSLASSKIFVMASLSCHNQFEGGGGLAIFRNGVLILPSASKGSQTEGRLNASMIGLTNSQIQGNVNFSGLDSPNSTSAQTYQVRVYNVATTTRTLYVNRPQDASARYFSVSTITLMEIAA